MLLFIVENIFSITGRGLILTPGPGENVRFVKIGAKIKLIRPDRSELSTVIKGILFQGTLDIMIPLQFSKEDIPIGTEVWTNE